MQAHNNNGSSNNNKNTVQAVRRTVTSAKLKKNQAHARLYQKCQTALGGAKVPCTAPRPASLISSKRMYIYGI